MPDFGQVETRSPTGSNEPFRLGTPKSQPRNRGYAENAERGFWGFETLRSRRLGGANACFGERVFHNLTLTLRA